MAFYDYYEDVLELLADVSDAQLTETSLFGAPRYRQLDPLVKGDIITGRATGRTTFGAELSAETEVTFEFADWISVEDPHILGRPLAKSAWQSHTVWIRQSEIKRTYQMSAERQKLREYFLRTAEENLHDDDWVKERRGAVIDSDAWASSEGRPHSTSPAWPHDTRPIADPPSPAPSSPQSPEPPAFDQTGPYGAAPAKPPIHRAPS